MLIDAILTTQPPQIDCEKAERLAESLYGMKLGAREVGGERDRNFHMTGKGGEAFLLKISNTAESADLVNFQTSALEYIEKRDPDVCVPRMVAAVSGEKEISLTLEDGRESIIRMLTYLPGMPLLATTPTSTQRRALGEGLARLNRALTGFEHVASDHDLPWNVAGAARLESMIDLIEDGERRQLLRHFMSSYEAAVMPVIPDLRTQVIHNDFNLGNVLVRPDQPDVIAAIIDFGDIIRAPLVGEVATGAAYQFARCDDPLTGAAEFIGAYNQVIPLMEEERAIIGDLVAARHMITVLITEWRAARYPENRTYIMRNNGLAWDGLNRLAGLSRDEARDRLLQNCVSGE